MSQQYQVLARKYRPKDFHELVGQTHVSKALINAIDYNRLHHAYLFTGTRGVGKTTIARILSKCLNCETGVTSTPCGICNSCVAIDAGRFIDLIEIDAASRTKVEDTRELIDNVPYAPSQGRFKVYLIDEVHMLSTHSFNALLKTLEEPPAHVKFLLATTDPQKLPITIISRCLQFVLRPLPQQAISEHLADILTKEHVAYTDAALWQLANAAKGSIRDALSLTDQAIAFGQGSLTNETVNDMLGLIDSADLIRLLADIYRGDMPAVATHIEQMRAQLVDAGSMFDGLAELLHQLAMRQLLPDVALNVNEQQAQQIGQLAEQIGADVLQLYYQIIIQGREQIKLANTPLQALEMSLLRLLAFRPLALNEVPVAAANATVSQTIGISENNVISKNISVPENINETMQTYEIETADVDHSISNPNPTANSGPIANPIANQYDPTNLAVHQSEPTPATAIKLASTANASPDLTDLPDVTMSTMAQSDSDSLAIEAKSEAETLTENDGLPSLVTVANADIKANDDVNVNANIATDADAIMLSPPLASQMTEAAIVAEQYNAIPEFDSETTYGRDSHLATHTSEEVEPSTYAGPITDSVSEPVELVDQPDENRSQTLLSAVAEVSISKMPISESSVSTLLTEAGNKVKVDATSVSDPRLLLQCAAVELTGEWTPEKWDFWLQSARVLGKLRQDELALARQGIMTGSISGHSKFKVAFNTKNMVSIFDQLADYLAKQFGATVTIAVDASLAGSQAAQLPQNRQNLRQAEAEQLAEQLLLQSSVLQKLVEGAQAKITTLKLLTLA